MKRFAEIFLAILIVCGLSNACNDPSTLGSEILPSEDSVDIQYRDDFKIEASSEVVDSALMYSEGIQFRHHFCGELNDPVFGKTEAQIFSQLRLLTKTSASDIASGTIAIDEVIMRATFSVGDPKGFKRQYFDVSKFGGNNSFGADILRLEAPLDRDSVYYSDQSFPTGERLGGFSVYDMEAKERSDKPYVEFSIKTDLWDELISYNDTVFSSDIILQQALNGIAFVPSPTDLSGQIYGLAAFDFGGGCFIRFIGTRESTDSEGNVTLNNYEQVLSIDANSARTVNFKTDRAGSMSETFSQDPVLNDSLVFLAGMAGWDLKLDFTDIESLGDVVINNAELELTINKSSDIPPSNYPLVLIASVRNDNGNLSVIEDVLGASGSILASYGGVLNYRTDDDGNVITYYKLNISKHLQRIISGDYAEKELYISVFDKQESALRVILGGAKNPDTGIKLKVTYTNL